MYLNKAIVFGNLTRDPELRALPSGMNVCNFSIATNRVFKDRDGKKQEQTDFHNIIVFGRQADSVAQYLKKGSSAFVEGRLQTRSWDGKDGEKKYRTEIVAETVQFGPRTKDNSEHSERNTTEQKDQSDQDEYPMDEVNTDDIPF